MLDQQLQNPFDNVPPGFDYPGFISWMKRKLIFSELLFVVNFIAVAMNVQSVVGWTQVWLFWVNLVCVGLSTYCCHLNYETIQKHRRVIRMALDKQHGS